MGTAASGFLDQIEYAVTRLRRPLTSAPPLPLCRQTNWAYPFWAPKAVAVTTLPAAGDLRVGSPAHSSGLPGLGGATGCDPGHPLYLGLSSSQSCTKISLSFNVQSPPLPRPRPTWLLDRPYTSPPLLLLSNSFYRVWFELSNSPIIALGAARGGVWCPPSRLVVWAGVYKTSPVGRPLTAAPPDSLVVY
ncbi:hypothetical protein LEMLEM_LOCUS10525 [Lemmus lemmus]